MSYDVHIKTTDGGVQYNALSYGVKEQLLWVQLGDDERSELSISVPAIGSLTSSTHLAMTPLA